MVKKIIDYGYLNIKLNFMNNKVYWYFDKAENWQQEIKLLRKMILDCQLSEELKWGVPTYTSKKSNIVLIHTFKKYCAF